MSAETEHIDENTSTQAKENSSAKKEKLEVSDLILLFLAIISISTIIINFVSLFFCLSKDKDFLCSCSKSSSPTSSLLEVILEAKDNIDDAVPCNLPNSEDLRQKGIYCLYLKSHWEDKNIAESFIKKLAVQPEVVKLVVYNRDDSSLDLARLQAIYTRPLYIRNALPMRYNLIERHSLSALNKGASTTENLIFFLYFFSDNPGGAYVIKNK